MGSNNETPIDDLSHTWRLVDAKCRADMASFHEALAAERDPVIAGELRGQIAYCKDILDLAGPTHIALIPGE